MDVKYRHLHNWDPEKSKEFTDITKLKLQLQLQNYLYF